MQEYASAHFGVVAVKPISDDVHRGDTGAYVVGVNGDASNLPAVLDLQLQLRSAEADNLAHGLFQVALTGSDQQQIIHVAKIMRHPVRALPAPELAHILLDMVIEWLQEEVGEPLRCVRPDGNTRRDSVDDPVRHFQQTGILMTRRKAAFNSSWSMCS